MNQAILFFLILNLFKYKTSITENTYDGDDDDNDDTNKFRKNKTDIVVPLKHLSNFLIVKYN